MVGSRGRTKTVIKAGEGQKRWQKQGKDENGGKSRGRTKAVTKAGEGRKTGEGHQRRQNGKRPLVMACLTSNPMSTIEGSGVI